MADDESTSEAEQLFLTTLDWLAARYGDTVFYVERDLVYTVQTRLNELLSQLRSAMKAYNDYPMLPGPRRAFSADLVLVNPDPADAVEVAVEFKYEPCHRRLDVLKSKLPVTVWTDIVKDTIRVREFVDQGRTKIGYAICIDEGSYLARRDLSIYADRQRWSGHPNHHHPVEALIFRYGPGSTSPAQ